MNTEKVTLAQNQPTQQAPVVVMPVAVPTSLPLNVATDLSMYNKISVVLQKDLWKITCLYERSLPTYVVYGEMPDGDKKILFTCSQHFQCCTICDQCIIGLPCCLEYACCDQIIFQMDYKRNNAPFFTQGFNIQKGCYCCYCLYCSCCPKHILYLRENVDPDSKDLNVGVQKGTTESISDSACCSCLMDKTVIYKDVNGLQGNTIRAKCCDVYRQRCAYCCFGLTCDFEIDIEDANGVKTGSIYLYSGCCSKKTEGKCCYFPSTFYEIVMPPGITSEQKFQIIANTVHFDLTHRII